VFEKNDFLTFGQPLRGACSMLALLVVVNFDGLELTGLVCGSAVSDNLADRASGFDRKCTERAGPRRFFMPGRLLLDFGRQQANVQSLWATEMPLLLLSTLAEIFAVLCFKTPFTTTRGAYGRRSKNERVEQIWFSFSKRKASSD
jgi:hypothetical protein